jgi:hypothetical protein
VRTINKYKNLKPALADWCLDSGGFTELTLFDRWVTTPVEYVKSVRRAAAIGRMQWASPQDYMCEPHMLKKTGLTIADHQRLTCENYLELRHLAADLPFIPVLQGWHPDDYRRHVELYAQYGVDLTQSSTVGLGSFCRRANVSGVRELVVELAVAGMHLHGFGLKKDGLRLFGNHLQSSDSFAWAFTARIEGRKGRKLCNTTHRATHCTNCKAWAYQWADDVSKTQQEVAPLLWEPVYSHAPTT